jgi:hypothetical protein
MISGGGLSAFMDMWLNHSKTKREIRDKDIDERITAWQRISETNESRLKQYERRIESCDRDFRCLERYILALEQIIVRADPTLELPERPILEKDLLERDKV